MLKDKNVGSDEQGNKGPFSKKVGNFLIIWVTVR